jgi:hypothetical protein
LIFPQPDHTLPCLSVFFFGHLFFFSSFFQLPLTSCLALPTRTDTKQRGTVRTWKNKETTKKGQKTTEASTNLVEAFSFQADHQKIGFGTKIQQTKKK